MNQERVYFEDDVSIPIETPIEPPFEQKPERRTMATRDRIFGESDSEEKVSQDEERRKTRQIHK